MSVVLKPGIILANRYEALRELGAGGMGEVWCCFDRRLQQEVALKRVRIRHAQDGRLARKIQQFFIEEVRALASLSHPNLVRALDFGQLEDTSPFLVMEYIDGLSLDQVWKHEQVLPWHLLASIVDQLLSGLAHIHARGILHRDLKPPNILLARTQQGELRVFLVDFGIAIVDHALDDFRPQAVLESQEIPTVGLGTPPYIAPEQVLAQLNYRGPCTDLHAVGVLLYQFSSGELPYWSEQMAKMIQNVAHQPPPTLHAINQSPPQLRDLLQQLLAKAPWQRGSFAASLRKVLRPMWEPELAHREWLRLLWRRGESLTDSYDHYTASGLAAAGDQRHPPLTTPSSLAGVRMSGHTGPFDPTASPADVPLIASTLPWGASSSPGNLIAKTPTQQANLIELSTGEVGSAHPRPGADGHSEGPGIGRSLSLMSLLVPSVVGREQEQTQLWEEVEAVCRGARRFVVLWGPAGIGKSRLAQWLQEQTHEHGLLLGLKSRLGDGASQQSGGFLGAIERHLSIDALDRDILQKALQTRWGKDPVMRDLSEGLTELMRPTPFVEQTPQQLAFHRPYRRNQLILSALHKTAAHGPLYIWLDDLQHIDDDNAALIELLLEQGPPFLLLATYQNAGNESASVNPSLATLLEHEESVHLRLQRLPDEALGQLLQSLLPLAPQTANALVLGSDGNPLFLIQQLFHWLQQGQIRWSEGPGWYEAPVALHQHLADSRKELWRQRIEALSPDLQKAARAAATLGRTFSLALLEQVFEELALAPSLGHELVSQQLLTIEREHCAWSHELIETFVRDNLEQHADASDIYRVAARVLAKHPMHFTRRMVRLRIHAMAQAGELEKACVALFGFLENEWKTRRDARQLREDLGLLPREVPPIHEAHRCRWEAEAALLSSAHDIAESAACEALEAYTEYEDNNGIAEAQRILGAIAAGRSRYQEALQWLTEALDTATLQNLPETIAQIQLLLAQTYQFMSRLHESAQFARAAYTLAEEWNINTVLVQSCLIQATAHHDLGEHTEARLWAEISLDACRLGGELYGEGQAHILLGWLDMIAAQFETALRHCDKAAACFHELDEWWWLASTNLTRGWALCWQGQLTEAAQLAVDTRNAFERRQMDHELGQTWLLTAAIQMQRGAFDEVATTLSYARESQRPEPMMRQPLALLEAWLAQADGRAALANPCLQRAISIWQQLGLTAWGVPLLLKAVDGFSWPDALRTQLDAWSTGFS